MGYGAADVSKCKIHGLLYVEECSACLQVERDTLRAQVAELTAWVHARQGCPSLAEVDAVNNHYREALEHIATCGAHESPQAIATEALKVQA